MRSRTDAEGREHRATSAERLPFLIVGQHCSAVAYAGTAHDHLTDIGFGRAAWMDARTGAVSLPRRARDGSPERVTTAEPRTEEVAIRF